MNLLWKCVVLGPALLAVLACSRAGFERSPCRAQACSGRGSCGVTRAGAALCACDPGYRNRGPLRCVPDPAATGLDGGARDGGEDAAAQPSFMRLEQAETWVGEGEGEVLVRLRVEPPASPLNFSWQTAGTASHALDYLLDVETGGSPFSAVAFRITLLDDGEREPLERLELEITEVEGAQISGSARHTVWIHDNDPLRLSGEPTGFRWDVEQPRLSPDGQRLIYTAEGGQVFSVALDGSAPRQHSQGDGSKRYEIAAVSATRQEVIYWQVRDGPEGGCRVWACGLDSEQPRALLARPESCQVYAVDQGERLLYMVWPPQELRSMRLDGQDDRLVDDGGGGFEQVYDLRLSPDGAWTAYLAQPHGSASFRFFAAALGAGAPFALGDDDLDQPNSQAQFSSDSAWILAREQAASTGLRRLISVRLADRSSRVLSQTATSSEYLYGEVITADAQRAVFLQTAGATSQLWQARLDGSASGAITPPAERAGFFAPAPDSTRVVYTTSDAGRGLVKVADLDGSGTRVLQQGDFFLPNNQLRFAPGRSVVIYIVANNAARTQDLVAAALDGSGTAALSSWVTGVVGTIEGITGDSQVLYLADKVGQGQRALHVIGLNGEGQGQLNPPLPRNAAITQVLGALDGSAAFYLADQDLYQRRELYRAELAGGQVTRVSADLRQPTEVRISWFGIASGAGATRVAYLSSEASSGSNSDLFAVDLDGGGRARLSPELAPFYQANTYTVPTLALDAPVLFFDGGFSHRGLFLAALDGSRFTRLDDPLAWDERIEDYVVSPDGQQVLYAQATTHFSRDLWLATADGQERRQLSPDFELGAWGLRPELGSALVLSLSLGRAFYLAQARANGPTSLFAVDLDSGATTALDQALPGGSEVQRFRLVDEIQRLVLLVQDSEGGCAVYDVASDGQDLRALLPAAAGCNPGGTGWIVDPLTHRAFVSISDFAYTRQLWTVDLVAGAAYPTLPGTAPSVFSFVTLLDPGAPLAMTARPEPDAPEALYLVPQDGASPSLLHQLDAVGDRYHQLSFVPEQELLLFVRATASPVTSHLFALQLDERRVWRVAPPPGHDPWHVISALPLPDQGQLLYRVFDSPGSQLRLVDLDGRRDVQLAADADYRFSPVPGARSVLYINGREGALFILPLQLPVE